ncbi:MAG TPA: hypothetical protein VGH20_16100 [Myxococcales bacterium]
MGTRLGAGMVALALMACAHVNSKRDEGPRPSIVAGKYAVESIRSRAQLDGVDQVVEISEGGTKLVDAGGAEHLLTERGALMLGENGACRLALAVSVDGEEPGISDRACTWQVDGDKFYLGEASGAGPRTLYKVRRTNGRVVLEGATDVDENGKVLGDAHGERIVLIERLPEYASRSIDRTSEEQAAREIQESLHDL